MAYNGFAIDEYLDAAAVTRQLDELIKKPVYTIKKDKLAAYERDYFGAKCQGSKAMSYMDQRSRRELKKGMANGLQVAGANVVKLARSLAITGAVSSSVKDPVWKYKWVEANEPENFARDYKWLDVKETLLCRCTGRFVMTEDSAYATLICDTRKGRVGWSREMCRMLGVRREHLAEIIKSTDVVGPLTEKAAAELGLAPGTPVFGGGGDASLIGVGAGCVRVGDTHVYCGTSGWVSTVLDRQELDTGAMALNVKVGLIGKLDMLKFKNLAKNRAAAIEASPATPLPEKLTTNEKAKFLHPEKQLVQVAEIRQNGADAKTIVLKSTDGGALAPFRAGQYLSVGVEIGNTRTTRSYSLCSSPAWAENGCYHITVKRDDAGFVSPYIQDHWTVGQEVAVSGPQGNLYYEPLRDAKKVVALAGGSGITPFM